MALSLFYFTKHEQIELDNILKFDNLCDIILSKIEIVWGHVKMDNYSDFLDLVNACDDLVVNYDILSPQKYFQEKVERSQKEVLNIIRRTPAFISFLKSFKPVELFDVTMSEYAQKALESGEWRFCVRKDGSGFAPLLRDAQGRFVEQVRLNPKQVTPDLVSSLNNLAIQQQLAQIVEQLEELNHAIERVEQGQRNDRIGLMKSGQQLALEAFNAENAELRKMLFFQSLETLSNAKYQLIETMKTDIKELMQIHNAALIKKWIHESSEAMNTCASKIRQGFLAVNRTTMLRTAIYSEQREYKLMQLELKAYGQLIEEDFLRNIGEGRVIDYLGESQKIADNFWSTYPNHILETIKNFEIRAQSNLIDSNMTNFLKEENFHESE